MAGTRIERPHIIVTESLRRRLYSRVLKSESGCWLWQGAINPNGYGKVKVAGLSVDSHVASWRVANDGAPVPVGKLVMHLCDVRRCVNPEHLECGTHVENMAHAIEIGTFQAARLRGCDCHTAVLTEDQVRSIRQMHSPKHRNGRKIARMFGLAHSTVRAVLNRQSWRHVE